MNYEPIIGLEIHVQTKTKSKMFCGCSADYFGTPPNSHTCPTCLGLPGALPVPNKKAIDHAVKIALALSCTINKETKFDRKNYFYPDLPKGYQISQYDQPIGEKGVLEINVEGKKKKIDITRVHQEEDTGKSIHEGKETLLDYNKSGVPLLEIVTEPVFRSGEEVVAFARSLRLILRYLDISDADMEKGQMRIEPNISLRKKGTKSLPDYKVEVKNIGSIAVLRKVIDKEIVRQEKLLSNGETPEQETRGLVDMSGETVSQRSKETEDDYRYFPEPDIPPIVFEDSYIEDIRDQISELPDAKLEKYTKSFGLPANTANTIIQDAQAASFFEAVIEGVNNKEQISEIAKWSIGDFSKLAKKYGTKKMKPEYLRELVALLREKKITRSNAKDVLKTSFESGKSPGEIVKEEDLGIVSDDSQIEAAINTVISNNPKAVEDIKKNPNAVMFLVGQVMQEMKGKADPEEIRKLIKKSL